MVYRAETMAIPRILIPYRHERKVGPYLKAVAEVGLEPVAVPVTEPASIDGFAGLLLMGGTDVNPSRYGQERAPETDEPDDRRDELEMLVLGAALYRDIPILAICRGLQVLNVLHGGTLIQHLGSERHDPDTNDVSQPAHEVHIEPESRLRRIAGQSEWRVNSRHHQAADVIGDGLLVSARSSDGVVEALERTDRRFVVAVQWHPEDQIVACPEQFRLFESFSEACGGAVSEVCARSQ
jgi:putative glutamine amidotransferase